MENWGGTRGLEKNKWGTNLQKCKKYAPGDYRLVSLTWIPSKIMEQILKEKIHKQLEFNGFIKNSSTETASF